MEETEALTGAICIREEGVGRELPFEEILLDERLVQCEIWVRREALRSVGGVNYRLKDKKEYELLLRIAERYTVLQCGREEAAKLMSEEDGHTTGEIIPFAAEDSGLCGRKSWLSLGVASTFLDNPNMTESELGWETDCYIISRYKDRLMEMDCFGDAVLGILETGGDIAAEYLEKMLIQSEEYHRISDCTQPFLIYHGDDICYCVLDEFAQRLGEALEELGQCVEYFDTSRRGIDDLGDYEGRRFKAVIGLQTYMFSVRYSNGSFVHDRIGGQKYNFVFDYPVWLKPHLMETPQHLCVLTPDGNYARFIQEYYGLPARFLPPAGREAFQGKEERQYDVVFLGSNKEGLVGNLRTVWRADKRRAHMINRWILFMRKYLEETPEQALERTLKHYRITPDRKEMFEWLYRERWVILGLAGQYRQRVMEVLLKAGIVIHVYGESWVDSPLCSYSGLIHHEAVIGEKALEVYANAKVALNVMTWHKDGFTERIANAMLQKAVVITDRTTYLEQHFENEEDLVLFDLRHMKDLPDQIWKLLKDEDERERIAENGYKKAQIYHTWKHRAEELLEIIEEEMI